MTLKTKLISCISAFVLVISLMLVTIMAVPNVTLNIGGNVSFTATSVNALITGSIEGTKSYPSGSPQTLTNIDIDSTDTTSEITMPSDWTEMDLTFDDNASAITITINIQNRSGDREIAVSLTDTTSIANIAVERKADDTTFSNTTDERTIAPNGTLTYTFTLTVDSQNSPASGAFGLDVSLENVEVQKYTATLTYTGVSYYAMGDNGVIVEVNGDMKQIKTSYISFALDQTYFQQTSANNLIVNDKPQSDNIEPYVFPLYGLYRESEIVADADSYYIWETTEDYVSVSEDGNVVTVMMTEGASFYIGYWA